MLKPRLSIPTVCLLAAAMVSGCQPVPKQRWNWPWEHHESDPHPGIRTSQQKIDELRALAKQAGSRSASELEALSTDIAARIGNERDPLVRMEMLRAVARWPTATAEGILSGGLADPDAEVRVIACVSWGQRRGPVAVQHLSKVMSEDADLDVRLAAAKAMGATGHPSALAPLAEALADADPAVHFRAISALKEVSGKDYGGDIEAWRQYARGEHPPRPEASVADRLNPLKWF